MSGSSSGSREAILHWVVLLSYIVAGLALIASLVLTFLGDLWVYQLGAVSSVSVGCVAVLYVLGHYRFRKAGYSELKSVVLAVLYANVFLQSYELIYNVTFGVALTGTEARALLLWLIMISPIILVQEDLRFGQATASVLLLFAAVWIVWILYGYPQYYYSGYSYPQILRTSDPFHLSLWLNFGSKTLLAAFFVSLLEPMKALKALLARLRSPRTDRLARAHGAHSLDGGPFLGALERDLSTELCKLSTIDGIFGNLSERPRSVVT